MQRYTGKINGVTKRKITLTFYVNGRKFNYRNLEFSKYFRARVKTGWLRMRQNWSNMSVRRMLFQ